MDITQLILNELLEELKQTPEQVQYEVLDFVLYLNHRRQQEQPEVDSEPIEEKALHFIEFVTRQREQEALELQEDLEALHAAREEMKREGTIPWEQVKQELGLPQ